ncbi:hypothetical protein R75483_00614 [Paraburkholderia domus]|nr:hypothetical protein R75483_00614 [Paraburkholderia domus]
MEPYEQLRKVTWGPRLPDGMFAATGKHPSTPNPIPAPGQDIFPVPEPGDVDPNMGDVGPIDPNQGPGIEQQPGIDIRDSGRAPKRPGT